MLKIIILCCFQNNTLGCDHQLSQQVSRNLGKLQRLPCSYPNICLSFISRSHWEISTLSFLSTCHKCIIFSHNLTLSLSLDVTVLFIHYVLPSTTILKKSRCRLANLFMFCWFLLIFYCSSQLSSEHQDPLVLAWRRQRSCWPQVKMFITLECFTILENHVENCKIISKDSK